MKPGARPRACAARAIADVIAGEALDRPLQKYLGELDERDHALYRELCFGTLRFYPRLKALLQQLLERPLRRRDQDIEALALLGLYQLEALRIPAHAAVSATVDAAALLRKQRMGGLLNAVLRRFQRESSRLSADLDEASAAAHPRWLWDELGRQWPEQRAAIVNANNSRPPMTLRINARLGSREAYAARLRELGMASAAGALSPAALVLAQAQDVERLPGFDEGYCSVQDEAAQMAAILLDARNGERILDACAAPGGKSGHILEGAPGCDLVAVDHSEERLQRVRENHRRLRQTVDIRCADSAALATCDIGSFDGILLDAPCSASGVIRRHPDIKLLRRAEDLQGFAAQQGALLRGLWPLLRPGGRLLYVTCSLFTQENATVVEDFLAATEQAQSVALTLPGALVRGPGMQLLPDAQGGDGLYFAMLKRRA